MEEYYKNEMKETQELEDQYKFTRSEEIFRTMRKIGKKYGYDNYLLFSMFDRNKKGYINSVDIF